MIEEGCNLYTIFIQNVIYEGSANFWLGVLWVRFIDIVPIEVMSANNNGDGWIKSDDSTDFGTVFSERYKTEKKVENFSFRWL